MRCYGSFATEIEILAAANLLQVDIYTYNADRWNYYPCIRIPGSHQPGDRNREAIYLNHKNGNHYDIMTCVKDAHNESICAKFDEYGHVKD